MIQITKTKAEKEAEAKAAAEKEKEEHEHVWVDERRGEEEAFSRSPYSEWDDHIWTWLIVIQRCECGARRKCAEGYKNKRRRGDDLRAESGLGPLGTPLQRSEMFIKPRVFRNQ